jgi:hypothetical protein
MTLAELLGPLFCPNEFVFRTRDQKLPRWCRVPHTDSPHVNATPLPVPA